VYLSTNLVPSAEDSEATLWRKLNAYLKDRIGITSTLFGFSHTRYLATRLGFTKSLFIKHNHPDDYVAHFPGDTFLDDDICAFILYDQLGPFFWSDAHDFAGATDEQRRRAAIDREFGMDVGVTLGFRFAGGQGICGIGLAARWMDPVEFRRRWRDAEEEAMARIALFEPLLRRRMVEGRIGLTPRQREVLALSIAGMIGKEIAARLQISDKRVEKIFDAIRTRMEADTTVEAVAKALAYEIV
jgi:DNA-binding CsgD family transcriptional regulator